MAKISKWVRLWIVLTIFAFVWSGYWIDIGKTNDELQFLAQFGPGLVAIIGWAIWWIRKGD